MATDHKKIIEKIDVVKERSHELMEAIEKGAEPSLSLYGSAYSYLATLLQETIIRFAPNDSKYSKNADYIINTDAREAWKLESLLGILEALRFAYSEDLLTSISEQIHKELFSDFLEMAEHLLKENPDYKVASAVLAGGVLEEHLRKLCQKNDIPIDKSNGDPRSTNDLNQSLYGANIYTKTEMKGITTWYGYRTDAAHGKPFDHQPEEVGLMIQGIRLFIKQYPA